MSVPEFFGDIFSGNFSHAWERLGDWWNNIRPEAQDFLHKLGTEQGKILQDLAALAAKDVMANGLTTASFVAAALDVEQQLVAREIEFARTEIFAVLNMFVK